MVPGLGHTSSSWRVHGFAKSRLIAWAQSGTIHDASQKGGCLCAGTVCMFMRAPRRSNASKGNCVQSSFSFHLIGLVFPDLGSRHKDQPLISCSWQLRLCLLFIGQHRMDHVTRHICTCCLGMWEDTQVDTDWWGKGVSKCLPTAGMEPSASSSYHPFPRILSMTTKSSLLIGRVFPGVDIMERKGVSLQGVLTVMHCVYTEQQTQHLSASFPLSMLGSNRPSGQVLNNTRDLLCSIYKIWSFSSVPVITPFWGGQWNQTHFAKEKTRHKETSVTLGFRERNQSGVSVCFRFPNSVMWETDDQGWSPPHHPPYPYL